MSCQLTWPKSTIDTLDETGAPPLDMKNVPFYLSANSPRCSAATSIARCNHRRPSSVSAEETSGKHAQLQLVARHDLGSAWAPSSYCATATSWQPGAPGPVPHRFPMADAVLACGRRRHRRLVSKELKNFTLESPGIAAARSGPRIATMTTTRVVVCS